MDLDSCLNLVFKTMIFIVWCVISRIRLYIDMFNINNYYCLYGFFLLALIPLGVGVMFIVKYKGYQYLALYITFIVQAVVGASKYESNYIPIIENEYIDS